MSSVIGQSYGAPGVGAIPSSASPTGTHFTGIPISVGSAQVMSNNSNVRYTTPIFAQPFKDGWETSYKEGMFLFGNTQTYTRNREALFTLPTLNYYLEKASVEKKNFSSLGLLDRNNESSKFYASTPEEILQKYGPLGVIDDQRTSSTNMDSRASDRLIGYAPSGSLASTFNIFSASLQQGDQVYFVAKKIESPYPYFFNPDGVTVSNRTDPSVSKILQVYGVSDKNGTQPFHNTHQFDDDAMDLDNMSIDYFERAHSVSQLYKRIDVDENGKVVELEIDEGDADALPPLIYDAYETGVVVRIGTVIQPPKQTAQASTILRAHRDNAVMLTLPRVQVSLSYEFL